MPAPRMTNPILAPTVELAYERFERDWPAMWIVYGDVGNGWKDPNISRVYAKVDGYRHLLGDERFREYHVRAIKVETAIDRVVEMTASPYPLCVTIYKVQLPLSAAELGALEAINAWLQRDPRWGPYKNRGRSRAVGTAPRAGNHHRNLSPQRRRSLSVGMR